MNDVAVSITMRYIDENLFEPQFKWPKIEFARRSYSRWAAYEILELLLDHPFYDAEILIEGFIMKMVYCTHVTENNGKSSFICTTTVDVAEDILFLCRG